jgi:tetratricopeptide (TPR) repeat protein
MKKISFLILIIVSFLTTNCSQKSETYRLLERIDSLLLELNMDDTATMLLKSIDLQTQADSAYFNILQAAADYDQNRSIKDTNSLNFSIVYYTSNYDNQKLAYAYYYKAIYYICLNKYNENVVFLLKKAEQHAENTNDLRLLNRIYAVLSIVNAVLGEIDESLKYSNKECYTAKKLNDNYCLAYALMSRAITFKAINCSDSSEHYIIQCKTLADNIDGADKALLYNYLGECFMQENTAAAKEYFLKALKYQSLTDAYANLAKIYYDDNQYELAEKYCDSALINTSIIVRNQIFTLMAEKSYEKKNLEKYKEATDKLINSLKDEMAYSERSKILELQKKFDYEKQQTEYEKMFWLLCTIICCLIGGCTFVFIWHQLRVQKIVNRELELENTNSLLYNEISILNSKIADCKNQLFVQNNNVSVQANVNTIDQLNAQLSELSTKMLVYMENGQQIFKLMEQNCSIIKHNKYWADCVFYFSSKNPEQNHIFDGYNGLTINDRIFIIIDRYMKKTDDEIASILSVSQVTVRTHRSKIKKKKANED